MLCGENSRWAVASGQGERPMLVFPGKRWAGCFGWQRIIRQHLMSPMSRTPPGVSWDWTFPISRCCLTGWRVIHR